MRKLRILCAAALICLLPGAALAADAVQADTAAGAGVTAADSEVVLSRTAAAFADVTEKGEDYLLVKTEAEDSASTEIQLNISADSILLDNTTGKEVRLADIKVGQRIYAYYDSAMTRSIPPQSRLEVLLTNVDKATPANYCVVEAFEAEENGTLYITADNGSLVVTVDRAAWEGGQAPALKAGDRLLAWYDAVMTSYPAQAVAQKAMLLPQAGAEAPVAEVKAKTAVAEVAEVLTDGDYAGILVKVGGQELQLNIDADFTAYSASDGTPCYWQSLKAGDKLLVNYGPQQTFSLPPQSPLNYMLVYSGEKAPSGMFVVEEVEVASGYCRILTEDGSLWLTLPKSVWNTAAPKAGDKLIVWYDAVQESYPAQATAVKALAVTAEKPAAPVYLKVGDKNLANVIETAQGIAYVPLRATAEALGFELTWDPAEMSAHITNGKVQTTVYINRDSYYMATAIEGMVGLTAPESFGAAPYLRPAGDTHLTYVPVQLFELLGFTVEVDAETNTMSIAE